MIKKILLSIILIFNNSLCHAQEDIGSRVKMIADEYSKSSFLNAAYEFSTSDSLIAKGAHGVYSVATGKELTVDEQMPVASVTKTMTAAAILKLHDQGLLNPEDTVAMHLGLDSGFWIDGKLPDWADKVKIHHLLTHTSGLTEYFMNSKLDHMKDHIEINKDILKFAANKELLFEPGAQFQYTNTNFVILGLIIEKLSKTNLNDYFKRELFEPAGMTHSRIIPLEEAINAQLDQSKSGAPVRYFVTPGDTKPNFIEARAEFIMLPYADGGVVSTTSDIIKWHKALHQGKILSKESKDLMLKQHFKIGVNKYDANITDYAGYGMFISEFKDGTIMYHHAGKALGIRCESGYILSKDIYFAVLSNVMHHIPQDMFDKIDHTDKKNQLDIYHFLKHMLEAFSSMVPLKR